MVCDYPISSGVICKLMMEPPSEQKGPFKQNSKLILNGSFLQKQSSTCTQTSQYICMISPGLCVFNLQRRKSEGAKGKTSRYIKTLHTVCDNAYEARMH